jgi:histone H3/H4
MEEKNVQRSLHYEIGNICRTIEEEDMMAEGFDNNHVAVKMSKEAIAALTELTYQFSITSFANDLAAFSAHGNRSTINGRDVKLALRKAPPRIREQFDKICAESNISCSTGKEQKKRNTEVSAISKSSALTLNKNKESSFNFNFEETSSDESDTSEIFLNKKSTNGKCSKLPSSSSSSRLDDDSSDNGDDNDPKVRLSTGRKEQSTLMSLGTESSSSDEFSFFDQDENDERQILQIVDSGDCIDLSSD